MLKDSYYQKVGFIQSIMKKLLRTRRIKYSQLLNKWNLVQFSSGRAARSNRPSQIVGLTRKQFRGSLMTPLNSSTPDHIKIYYLRNYLKQEFRKNFAIFKQYRLECNRIKNLSRYQLLFEELIDLNDKIKLPLPPQRPVFSQIFSLPSLKKIVSTCNQERKQWSQHIKQEIIRVHNSKFHKQLSGALINLSKRQQINHLIKNLFQYTTKKTYNIKKMKLLQSISGTMKKAQKTKRYFRFSTPKLNKILFQVSKQSREFTPSNASRNQFAQHKDIDSMISQAKNQYQKINQSVKQIQKEISTGRPQKNRSKTTVFKRRDYSRIIITPQIAVQTILRPTKPKPQQLLPQRWKSTPIHKAPLFNFSKTKNQTKKIQLPKKLDMIISNLRTIDRKSPVPQTKNLFSPIGEYTSELCQQLQYAGEHDYLEHMVSGKFQDRHIFRNCHRESLKMLKEMRFFVPVSRKYKVFS